MLGAQNLLQVDKGTEGGAENGGNANTKLDAVEEADVVDGSRRQAYIVRQLSYSRLYSLVMDGSTSLATCDRAHSK
ncbi:hypothetical protein HYQ46_009357 [Verticillium longisporum]|nr:hypothetical protein HYQ46_009357 [Verticillium longisporum]